MSTDPPWRTKRLGNPSGPWKIDSRRPDGTNFFPSRPTVTEGTLKRSVTKPSTGDSKGVKLQVDSFCVWLRFHRVCQETSRVLHPIYLHKNTITAFSRTWPTHLHCLFVSPQLNSTNTFSSVTSTVSSFRVARANGTVGSPSFFLASKQYPRFSPIVTTCLSFSSLEIGNGGDDVAACACCRSPYNFVICRWNGAFPGSFLP